jgi:hypothetical protein
MTGLNPLPRWACVGACSNLLNESFWQIRLVLTPAVHGGSFSAQIYEEKIMSFVIDCSPLAARPRTLTAHSGGTPLCQDSCRALC